jgi:hypothetical protein
MEKKIYEQPKNDSDFNQYHQKSISMNEYSERLLQKVRLAKGQTYDSQTIRNLIYEEYHRLKDEGKI